MWVVTPLKFPDGESVPFEVVNRDDEGVDDILRLSSSAEAALGRAPSSVSSLGGYGSRSAGCP